MLFKKYKYEGLIFLFSLTVSILANYNSEVLDQIFIVREYNSIYHNEDYFINLFNISSTIPILFNYIFYYLDNLTFIGLAIKFLFTLTSFMSVFLISNLIFKNNKVSLIIVILLIFIYIPNFNDYGIKYFNYFITGHFALWLSLLILYFLSKNRFLIFLILLAVLFGIHLFWFIIIFIISLLYLIQNNKLIKFNLFYLVTFFGILFINILLLNFSDFNNYFSSSFSFKEYSSQYDDLLERYRYGHNKLIFTSSSLTTIFNIFKLLFFPIIFFIILKKIHKTDEINNLLILLVNLIKLIFIFLIYQEMDPNLKIIETIFGQYAKEMFIKFAPQRFLNIIIVFTSIYLLNNFVAKVCLHKSILLLVIFFIILFDNFFSIKFFNYLNIFTIFIYISSFIFFIFEKKFQIKKNDINVKNIFLFIFLLLLIVCGDLAKKRIDQNAINNKVNKVLSGSEGRILVGPYLYGINNFSLYTNLKRKITFPIIEKQFLKSFFIDDCLFNNDFSNLNVFYNKITQCYEFRKSQKWQEIKQHGYSLVIVTKNTNLQLQLIFENNFMKIYEL